MGLNLLAITEFRLNLYCLGWWLECPVLWIDADCRTSDTHVGKWRTSCAICDHELSDSEAATRLKCNDRARYRLTDAWGQVVSLINRGCACCTAHHIVWAQDLKGERPCDGWYQRWVLYRRHRVVDRVHLYICKDRLCVIVVDTRWLRSWVSDVRRNWEESWRSCIETYSELATDTSRVQSCSIDGVGKYSKWPNRTRVILGRTRNSLSNDTRSLACVLEINSEPKVTCYRRRGCVCAPTKVESSLAE